MTADWTIVDWALTGALALLALIGLFRGISGELGSLLGIAAGVLAFWLLYGVAGQCAASALAGHDAALLKGATIAIDAVFALLAGGTVRFLVRKFVSFLIGRALDAGLGLLSGVVKGVLLIGVVTGLGVVQTGDEAAGPLAARSPLIAEIASWTEAYAPGNAQ